MIISLAGAMGRNHVYIIVREGFWDNYVMTWMPSIWRKQSMDERLKSVMLYEDSYRIVQNVVTNSTINLHFQPFWHTQSTSFAGNHKPQVSAGFNSGRHAIQVIAELPFCFQGVDHSRIERLPAGIAIRYTRNMG
jgi:hypothetical protein